MGLFAVTSCDQSVSEFPDTEGEVQFLNLSPDAPAIDYHFDGQPFAENLSYNELTGFQSIPTGIHMNEFMLNGDTLVDGPSRFFEHGRRYTIIALDSLESMKMRTIENYLTNEPDTTSRIRVLHASTTTSDVDVIVVEPNASFDETPSAAFIEVSFNNGSGTESISYSNLTVGDYQMRVTSAGSPDEILIEQDLSLDRHNYTIILLNGENEGDGPRLKILTDNEGV